MATYVELVDVVSGGGGDLLKKKIKMAVVIAAETIRTEDIGVDNHANRLIWAAEAFNNPDIIAVKMLWALLAQNAGADVATITGADDSMLQTAVDGAVDVFATG